ncbi:MAG: hypothetical protein H7A24_14935 [Leptospiraceae bacterium]|nr:hypothetical protein [Leptospiraceae bacterium]MCP5513179.1 hypothetical protein [Leptospiraceae bacterium]
MKSWIYILLLLTGLTCTTNYYNTCMNDCDTKFYICLAAFSSAAGDNAKTSTTLLSVLVCDDTRSLCQRTCYRSNSSSTSRSSSSSSSSSRSSSR